MMVNNTIYASENSFFFSFVCPTKLIYCHFVLIYFAHLIYTIYKRGVLGGFERSFYTEGYKCN